MSLCAHGINTMNHRCDRCEEVAEAEHRVRCREFDQSRGGVTDGRGIPNMARLRELWDEMLVAEIGRYGGIPKLSEEELAFREAIAELLK